MLPDGRRLGPHLALGHGMVRAARRAVEIRATAVQVFVDNPTAWRRRAGLPRAMPAFRAILAEGGIDTLAIHASYLVNLAGPDDRFWELSVGVLARELSVGVAYGAEAVNVHTGSHRGAGAREGARRLAEGTVRVLETARAEAPSGAALPRLVFENAAGAGFALGATLDELVLVDEACRAAGVPTEAIGYCLDAAHAWGAGNAVGEPAAIDAFHAEYARRLGLERLRLVHLNDSRSERGSGTDRHEHVGAGRIGQPGLRHLLLHPDLAHATYLLETPGMDEGYDAVNLERVRDLAAGRPLPTLPPAAFRLRSARGRTGPAEDAADDGDEVGSAGGGRRATRATAGGRTRRDRRR